MTNTEIKLTCAELASKTATNDYEHLKLAKNLYNWVMEPVLEPEKEELVESLQEDFIDTGAIIANLMKSFSSVEIHISKGAFSFLKELIGSLEEDAKDDETNVDEDYARGYIKKTYQVPSWEIQEGEVPTVDLSIKDLLAEIGTLRLSPIRLRLIMQELGFDHTWKTVRNPYDKVPSKKLFFLVQKVEQQP